MTAPVTVAVVSWNTATLLAECLRSLEPEVEAGRAEVWVVDNGSTDGSPELVEREFPRIHLLRPERNLGYGAAVNLVAARTESPWIAAANSDVELSEGALAALLEAGQAEPRVGIVAPRLIMLDGATQHSVHPFPTVTVSLVLHLGLARIVPRLGDRLCFEGHWDERRPRAVDWAHGAFLLIRRAAFEQIGGFDSEQWMYAEDLDLAWRLRQAGWATRYEPRAVVDHDAGSSTVQAFGKDPAPVWQRSTYGFLVRRRGVAYAWAIALLNIGGALLRWAWIAPHSLRSPERYAEIRRAHARWIVVNAKALRGRAALEAMR